MMYSSGEQFDILHARNGATNAEIRQVKHGMIMSKYFGDLAVFHLAKKTGRSGLAASLVQNGGTEVNGDGGATWDFGEGRGGREWVDRARGNPFPAMGRLGAARARRSGRPWCSCEVHEERELVRESESRGEKGTGEGRGRPAGFGRRWEELRRRQGTRERSGPADPDRAGARGGAARLGPRSSPGRATDGPRGPGTVEVGTWRRGGDVAAPGWLQGGGAVAASRLADAKWR